MFFEFFTGALGMLCALALVAAVAVAIGVVVAALALWRKDGK